MKKQPKIGDAVKVRYADGRGNTYEFVGRISKVIKDNVQSDYRIKVYPPNSNTSAESIWLDKYKISVANWIFPNEITVLTEEELMLELL